MNHGGVNTVFLDEHGKTIPVEFTREDDRIYLEQSWDNFQKLLRELLDECYTTDFLMAVKGPDNFRNVLYDEYKLNRHADPSTMNKFVPILRKLAVKEELAVESIGREADDLIRMWATQAAAAGDPFVIASIDKDLRCIPGSHYDMKAKELYNVSELEAMQLYYGQLLMGDSTDKIPGVPGLGKVKSKAILKGCVSHDDFQDKVVEQYMLAHGDQWREYLLINGKLIHLQRHEDDYFNFNEWPIVQALA